MRTISALLLLASSTLFAQAQPPAQAFPDEYKPHPCATRPAPFPTYPRIDLASYLGTRGRTVPFQWIDRYHDEFIAQLEPFAAKAQSCYANPANSRIFCNDMSEQGIASLCTRFAEGTDDYTWCRMVSGILWTGYDRNSKEVWQQIRACADQNPSPGERTLSVWMTPEKFGPEYGGTFTVYAVDSETRIPVQALVSAEGQKLRGLDVPEGKATAGYGIAWKMAWNRVPRADGHADVVPPRLTVSAAGYATVSMPMLLPEMKLVVESTPKRLSRGKNVVTITARDAATGQPVEMQVMAGYKPVGKSNEPFELVIAPGARAPEIWLTSHFNRYSDVVVIP